MTHHGLAPSPTAMRPGDTPGPGHLGDRRPLSAKEFNDRQIEDGELSAAHLARLIGFWANGDGPDLVRLVELWQRGHGLKVDGYAGSRTINSLGREIEKFWPLHRLPDGRVPLITSKFHTENQWRSTHMGVDMFYVWLDSDPDMPLGDGGAIKRNGKRRWWYPPGTVARAAADGIVQLAGDTETGFRVWVDHGNGERTGYFHGSKVLVKVGDTVFAGEPLIVVGDNPKGHDAKHLHFEVSPVARYAPTNPRDWLRGAKVG